MRRWMILAGLLVALPASAQSAQVLAWDYDVAPAEVATYTQTVTVDNVGVSGALACVAGTGPTVLTTCTVTIPSLAAGAHVVTITASKGGMTATSTLSGLNPTTGAHTAKNVRILLTVVVTVP